MTDVTTTAIVTEIRDPKLRVIARNLRSMLHLAMTRVAAHHAAPAAISLPTTGLEAVLAQRFAAMPADRQRRAAERATALLAGAGDRVARFGPAGAASLRSNLPIADQVRDRLVPRDLGLTAGHLEALRLGDERAIGGFRPLQTLDKLEVRLHRVRCIDETNPEIGSDTILMGGTAIAANGTTTKLSSWKVGGGFDDNDAKTFSPPKQLTKWSVVEGTAWPKTYFLTVVLAEQDNGGFPKFLDELFQGLRSEVISALAAAIGGVIGATGGPVAAAIGAVVGWAVGELYTLLKDWWEDDEFPPITISCSHAGLGARFTGGAADSPEGRLYFRGHGGTYEVTYDWRLFA